MQAVLSKAAGLAAPLEISFERERPSRPIWRLLVWAGGPFPGAVALLKFPRTKMGARPANA